VRFAREKEREKTKQRLFLCGTRSTPFKDEEKKGRLKNRGKVVEQRWEGVRRIISRNREE